MISGIGSSGCGAIDAGSRESFFGKMDSDGNGKVTKDEMKAAFDARADGAKGPGGPPPGGARSIDDLFAEIDTNGDGGIDEEEDATFRAARDAGHAARQQQSIDLMRELLSRLDADSDGSLSSSELATLFGDGKESASAFSATA